MVKNNTLISVIVPVYNVEKYIRKCVNSILAQSYRNFEIILIEDGSPDACGDICDEYAANNSMVSVLHKENGGLSDARNAGLNIAKGELICFVDSDDWCEKEMLRIAFEAMEKSKCDMVSYGAFYDFTKNEKVFRTMIKNTKSELKINSFEECLPLVIRDDFAVTAWNKLYKKTIFENLRFPKGKLFEDVWIFPKLFENGNSIYAICQPLYHYIVRSDGKSITSNFNLRNMEILEAYESWQNFEKKGNLSKKMLMQNAWYMLTRIGAQKENEIYSKRIIKLLTENLEHLKISKFYDRFFLFLVLKKFNYKRIFSFRTKIQELFFFTLKIFSKFF
jgi:glycosyltransferase involved in cell wall biosynthesis